MNKIKQLSLGELLDQTIRLYVRHFWPLVTISLLALLPTLAVNEAARQYIPSLSGFIRAEVASQIKLIIVLPVHAFLYGALYKAITDAYLYGSFQLNDAFRAARKRYLPMMATTLIWNIALGFGLSFFAFPGFYMMVIFCFYVPIVLLENLSGFSALRRSYALVKGAFWRISGRIFVITLLTLIMAIAVLTPGIILVGTRTVIFSTLFRVVLSIISPLLSIGFTLLYFDQRVRREGFDLWLAADQINAPVREPA